jgi:hypothetical protein
VFRGSVVSEAEAGVRWKTEDFLIALGVECRWSGVGRSDNARRLDEVSFPKCKVSSRGAVGAEVAASVVSG